MRNPAAAALRMSVDQLVEAALRDSSYVHVVSAEPRIRQTAIVEEQAAFDWGAFLETTYNDLNEPVGNVLTTGTLEDRYKDRTWSSSGGVRRQNLLGGKTELSQRVGSEENNSRFLEPNPQATTQLELRYTQPLLNGAGRSFNESRIVLARIHTEISSDELAAELEEHLVKVTEAYWELYRAGRVLPAAEAGRFRPGHARDSRRARWGRRRAPAGAPARAAVSTRMSEIVRRGRRFATQNRSCGCWSTIRPWSTRRVRSSLLPKLR